MVCCLLLVHSIECALLPLLLCMYRHGKRHCSRRLQNIAAAMVCLAGSASQAESVHTLARCVSAQCMHRGCVLHKTRCCGLLNRCHSFIQPQWQMPCQIACMDAQKCVPTTQMAGDQAGVQTAICSMQYVQYTYFHIFEPAYTCNCTPSQTQCVPLWLSCCRHGEQQL